MDRLVVDVRGDGRVGVSVRWDGTDVAEAVGEPVEWSSPLGATQLEELRWYLEDYLRAPFAVYEERGAQVEAALSGWGQALFSSVFGAGEARDAYVAVRSRGAAAQVVVRAADDRALGLPWELLRDPGLPEALALGGVAVTRMLPTHVPAPAVRIGGERLRVLMVIARPAGERDVGYQMVARRLLPLLAGVRGAVELTVLRPPTFARFERVLNEAARGGEPFQVVHFDGHGAFANPPAASAVTAGGAAAPAAGVVSGGGSDFDPLRFTGPASGVLTFEQERGGADHIEAARVGHVLAAARVPLVVLNACQSGQVGGAVEAGVATRLLQGGASSVVAMAYSVYAVAAAEFMAVFYERLFAGDTVTEAVTAARSHVAVENRRPSPKGRLPLSDWMVPVHYARTEVSFPQLRAKAAAPGGTDSLQEIMRRTRAGTAEPAQQPGGEAADDAFAAAGGVFVGRDGPLYTLDTAARLQHVVVVHGPGGTGKSELAKAFARWWRDTGGVENPGWVLWHSFEPGVASFGLDGAVTDAGLGLFGAQFAMLEPAQRREALLQALEQHRILLIWDNFESAYTMPDPTGATPPLDERERAELVAFLSRVRERAAGSIVITSRTREDWLGGEVRHLELEGLGVDEAAEYTDRLLEPYPGTRALRQQRAFGELLDWLDGHPLSMRLTLPQLDHTPPGVLLEALKGHGQQPMADKRAGRTASLSASVAYSFTHLSAKDRDALTILALLHGVADKDVLGSFSAGEMTPAQFQGMSRDDWQRILDQAAAVGLLSEMGLGMYRIHPALPAYLAAQWHAAHPDDYEDQREQATRALLDSYAGFSHWLKDQIGGANARFVVPMVDVQRRNLGALLGYAFDHQLWEQAAYIAQPLNRYWDLRGLHVEARGWVDRARAILESPDGTPPDPATDAGELWTQMVAAEANRQLLARHFDEAEAVYRAMLDALESQEVSRAQRRSLATIYHQLGIIAQEKAELAAAEDWYRKSLAIKEELGDRHGAAGTYHELGIVAQNRQHLKEAEDWHRRALPIFEEVGDRNNVAMTYHHLGIVAQDGGDLAASEAWHRRALAVRLELGDRRAIGASYFELGNIAFGLRDLDHAEEWHRRSLTIKEQLGNRPGASLAYEQLGAIALARGQFDAAEQWFRKSLAVKEELGDWRGVAASYHRFGRLAQDRGQPDEAEQWFRKSMALNEQLGAQPSLATDFALLGIVAQERGRLDEAEQWLRKSLAIQLELESPRGAAMIYAQLALLDEQRGNQPLALEETVRSVALFEQIPHPATGTAPHHLRSLTADLGVNALEDAWRTVTGNALPPEVRAFATAA